MKRCILVVFLILLMCGCQNSVPEYLISSIGFDKQGDKYNLCAEAVIVNTENPKQSLKVLMGNGKTIEEAVNQIKSKSTQPLLLSHCGVILLSENISEEDYSEIKEYSKREGITLSAFVVKTQNPKKVLSVKPVASACVGYDIMGLLKQNNSKRNRLFEVKTDNFFGVVPKVNISDGGIVFEN